MLILNNNNILKFKYENKEETLLGSDINNLYSSRYTKLSRYARRTISNSCK